MEKVIVFTNQDSLSFKQSFSNRSDLCVLNKENQILYYNEIENLFRPVLTMIENGLYFVLDSIEESTISSQLTKQRNSDIYFLQHKLPKFSLQDYGQVQKGEHDNNGKFYPNVLKILLDSHQDKVKRILTEVFNADPEIDLWLKRFENIAPNVNDTTLQSAAAKIKVDIKHKYNL